MTRIARFTKEILDIRDRHKMALADTGVDPVIGSTKLFNRDLQKALVLAHVPEPVEPITSAYEKAVSRGAKVPHFITLARHITESENDLPRLVSITKQMVLGDLRGEKEEDNPLSTDVMTLPYIGSLTGIGASYLRLFKEITSVFDEILADSSSRQAVENGIRFVKDTLLELTSFSDPETGIYSKTYLVPAFQYSSDLLTATEATKECAEGVSILLAEVEHKEADYIAKHAELANLINEEKLLDHLNLLCEHTVLSERYVIEQSIAELDAMAYAVEISALVEDPIGSAAMADKGGPEIQSMMDRKLADFYARYDTVLPVEDDPGPPIDGDEDCPCC